MSRRRRRRHDEEHRRFLVWFGKGILALAAFGLVSYYSYEVGFRVAAGENSALREAAQQAEERLKEVQAEAEGERAEADRAGRQLEDVKKLYEQTRPSDEMVLLETLVQNRLKSGFDARRLALVIRSAEMPRDCQVLSGRRFMVRTPHMKGRTDGQQVRLDDTLVVSGDGVGANDGREQWFDSAKPVTLHIAAEGGRDTSLSGALPLETMLNAGNGQYHLTVSATTARGWVEVAVEKCRL